MSVRFHPPPKGEPITQWARLMLDAIQFDVRLFEDSLFGRITAASGRYHADSLDDVAASLRLHASLLEEKAAKLREITDA